MAHETIVRAQVRLQLRDVSDKVLQVQRAIEAIQKVGLPAAICLCSLPVCLSVYLAVSTYNHLSFPYSLCSCTECFIRKLPVYNHIAN